MKTIRIRPLAFRATLLIVVNALLLFNVVQLIRGNRLSLVPIALQVPLVAAVTADAKPQVFLTRLWSGIIVIAGAAGWVNALANLLLLGLQSKDTNYETFGFRHIAVSTAMLVFGAYVFVNCKRLLAKPAAGSRQGLGAGTLD